MDYEATLAKKLSIAKKMFSLEKDVILNSSSFSKFFTENEVEPFSVSYNTQGSFLRLCCMYFYFFFVPSIVACTLFGVFINYYFVTYIYL